MLPAWLCGTPWTTKVDEGTKIRSLHWITKTYRIVFWNRGYHRPEMMPPKSSRSRSPPGRSPSSYSYSGKTPKQVIRDLLLRSGDIESNPGPANHNRCANPRCNKVFTNRDHPVECTRCHHRFHKTHTQHKIHTINKILGKGGNFI